MASDSKAGRWALIVSAILFTIFVMPETRGRSLESLAEGLSKHVS